MSRVLALAGGVGGAKLARGLALSLEPGELTIVVNTADDFTHLGLEICPDLDSVTYALAGLNDEERGWGLREESWQFMQALARLGGESWFSLGDQDLATHVLRTAALRAGGSLSEVTTELTTGLGIDALIAPMSDDPVRTMVTTEEGELEFQRYFVERRCEPIVRGFRYAGAETAALSPTLADALADPNLEAIIICPSNPFISIDPMLCIRGMRDALTQATAPIVAVTPIIGSEAVKGPAAKMLRELGLEQSAIGIARHYGELLDGFILDETDSHLGAGLDPLAWQATDTWMRNDGDRKRVAATALALAGDLGAGRT